MLDSFSNSYGEARSKFLAGARDAYAQIHSYERDDLRGKEGEALACDVVVLGDYSAERAVIVIAGTHGAEGYCGSAIQHRWLMSQSGNAHVAGVKVVLVHAINPWGFSHKTRTTENNVDLNRNFLRDQANYERLNPSYDKLAPFLHGDIYDASHNLAAYLDYKAYLDENGWHIENEMLQGQSHRPDGFFYAGKEPEWANRVFRRIVNEHLGAAHTIGFIDWHTGVGSYGEVVHLIFDDEDSPEHAAATRWWGDKGTGGGGFSAGIVPKYEGLICKAIRQELPKPRIAGAVIEFGVADPYGMFRSDRLDRWLWNAGRSDAQYKQFREDYKVSCCPNDVAWKRLVMREGPKKMDQLIQGVLAW